MFIQIVEAAMYCVCSSTFVPRKFVISKLDTNGCGISFSRVEEQQQFPRSSDRDACSELQKVQSAANHNILFRLLLTNELGNKSCSLGGYNRDVSISLNDWTRRNVFQS